MSQADEAFTEFADRVSGIPGVIMADADVYGSLCEVRTFTEGRDQSRDNSVYEAELAVIDSFPDILFDFHIIYS